MPIFGDTQPVQTPTQDVEPFSPSPIQQIARTGERLSQRLSDTRDELADLQMTMVEQDVLPEDQTQFAIATENIRNRINKIAESDELYNKLPQVRREARRFAEVAQGFKQNRENVEASLESLRDAEGLTDSQRAVLEQRIRQRAPVQLTDDNVVDPSSVTGQINFRDAQDPREYLDDALGSMKERVFNNIQRQNGVIRDTEFRRLSRSRLTSQGLKELGFTLKDPNKDLTSDNLQKVASSSPKVERWMRRERAVAQQIAKNRLQKEGVNPSENPDKLRKKVDQYMKDKVINMVNTVAGRHVSGDETPDVTIKSDPAADGSGTGGDSSEDIAMSTVTPDKAVIDPQSQRVAEIASEGYIDNQVSQNENITKSQYEKIDKKMKEGKRPSATHAYMTGGPSGPAGKFDRTNRQELINKYGEDAILAYENIKEGEKSTVEAATEQNQVIFSPGSTARNELGRLLESSSADNFEASGVNDEQLRWLLSDSNNFVPMGMNQEGNWYRVKVRKTDGEPGGNTLSGIFGGSNDLQAGQEIIIQPKKLGIASGTQEQDIVGALTEHLPESQAEVIREERSVANKPFGKEWKPANPGSDIDIKLDKAFVQGQAKTGNSVVTPKYTSRVGNNPVTFGDVALNALKKAPQDEVNELFEDMAGAANKIPEIIEGIRNKGVNMSALNGESLARSIREYYSEDSDIPQEARRAIEYLLSRPIPSTRPGRSAEWARTYKKLTQ